MKTKQLTIVLIMIFLISSGYGSFAQRRVVNTPRRTVVQGPAEQLFTGKPRL
ncbi:hypothetical protein [Maribellus maritimus]|uniref:hypothetical protein n=1 Tax=Maribellus maritimus TaxID=2870838 RepID=UPI001EEACE81|nr:hypothetical protein [Maribellus maritimus]MCG6189831.1 hypothetical protein [Maribellus maritimus]